MSRPAAIDEIRPTPLPPRDEPPLPRADATTASGPGTSLLDPRQVLELLRERDQWRRLSESDGRGFVVLTGAGRVHWSGRRARAMLSAYGLPLTRGQLPAPLDAWLEPITSGSALTVAPLRRRGGHRSLTIRHHPHEGHGTGAMLSVEEQVASRTEAADAERHVPVIARELGLTHRQAEVALWMSEGKSNSEIAIILAIRTATVKKHAERIFAALGVDNRTSAAGMIHHARAEAPATAA